MRFNLATVALALPILAAATPVEIARRTSVPLEQCNAEHQKCCEVSGLASSDPGVFSAVGGLLGVLTLVASVGNVVVGLTCTPLTVIGGAAVCEQKAVCCTNNQSVLIGLLNIPVNTGCLDIL